MSKSVKQILAENTKRFYAENYSKAVEIPLYKIRISEEEHRNALKKITPDDKKTMDRFIKRLSDKSCCIVRAANDGRYELVSGWSVVVAKAILLYEKYGKDITAEECLNSNIMVKSIVVDVDRKTFRKRMLKRRSRAVKTTLNTADITILPEFKNTPPSQYKVDRAIQYYAEHGAFDEPVTCLPDHTLINGYSRYVAALELGVNEVPARIVPNKRE